MRQRLVSSRTQLTENCNEHLDALNVSSESGDSADQASDNHNGEISARLAGAEFREIKDIDKALRQIADGSYGICDGCRKNIPMKRLEAIPHASFCIDCKRLAEEHDIEGQVPDWSAIHGFDSTFADPDASVS